jgi:hypothetical protein
MYRANYVRSRDKMVMPAILALRAKRLYEKQFAAALVIQCFFRRSLAESVRRFLWTHLKMRINSSILIQTYTRRMLAQNKRKRYRLFDEMYLFYCIKMSLKIQCFTRQFLARKELKNRLAIALSDRVAEHCAARVIQSHYRGLLGWKDVKAMRLIRTNAAIHIQKIFRGHMVNHWRDIKWKMLASHIKQRAILECEEVRQRHVMSAPQVVAQTSNVEEEVIATCDGDNLSSSIELLTHAFGETYIGFRCLIYWEPDGLYRSCLISRYDERIRLWKIAYDQDYPEWLDLVKEQDRVMINNGVDFVPFSHFKTRELEAYLSRRDVLQTSQKRERSETSYLPTTLTHTERHDESVSIESSPKDAHYIDENSAFIERETAAGQCDLFMAAYVARGLLDQHYKSKTKESLEKIRHSHIVKALAVSIGLMKKKNSNSNLEHYSGLLNELQDVLDSGI